MDRNLLSDTYIYTRTYKELVEWVKYLTEWRKIEDGVYDRNIRQAGRIMELEFQLRKYMRIMKEDQQETVVKEYGTVESDVVSNEEFQSRRLKRSGGGGGGSSSHNWISPLPWGTIVYVRPKREKPWLLAKFLLAGFQKGVAWLVPMHGMEDVVSDDREWVPVEPVAFCEYFELIAAITPVEESKDG